MNIFAKNTALLLPMIYLGAPLKVDAQFTFTQLDGLQIRVTGIGRFGDTRDLDCSIGLMFTGEKVCQAFSMSLVKIIQAVDDTGMDLVRTNKHFFDADGSPSAKTALGFVRTIGGLKAPSPNAKTIRHLEGEVNLAIPTTSNGGRFVVENFMSRAGEVIHHARLEEYGIKLTYHTLESYVDFQRAQRKKYVDALESSIEKSCFSGIYGNPTNPPRTAVAIQIDDPQQKLLSFAFERADGKPLRATGTSTFPGFHCYRFDAVPPNDLKLVVFVAAPGAVSTEWFSLENIRLPWVDPPDVQVVVGEDPFFCCDQKDSSDYHLLLNFIGGQVTNSAGIRKLWINRAEDETGQALKVKESEGGLSPLENSSYTGRHISKLVTLETRTKKLKKLRVLEGEAELYFPSRANGGMVEFNGFLSQTNKPLLDAALQRSGVKLAFLGRDNFETRWQEWKKPGQGWHLTVQPSTKTGLSETVKDSLQFSIEDPERRLVKLVFLAGKDELNPDPEHVLVKEVLLDGKGELLPAGTPITRWPNLRRFRLYNFKVPPPEETRVMVYLTTPESLRRIPFKVENILLP